MRLLNGYVPPAEAAPECRDSISPRVAVSARNGSRLLIAVGKEVNKGMPNQRKIDNVATLTDKLARMQVTVVADYRGLSVADITDLRKRLRESGAELIVAKNTLTLIAARETGHAVMEPLLAGPTALAIAYDDVPKLVKAINEFNRGPRKLAVRGGVLGSTLLKEDVLERVASLPTKEQVRAEVVGGIAAPVNGLAGVLAAPVNDIVNLIDATSKSILYVLQARADQLQGEPAAA